MSLKFNVSTGDDDEDLEFRYANSDTFLMKTNNGDDIKTTINHLLNQFEKVLNNGSSNCVYQGIIHFRFNTAHQKNQYLNNVMLVLIFH